MKNVILSILFIFTFVSNSFSIGQEWLTRYNGAGNSLDWAYAIALDPAGNVVVTGYSTGAGTGKDYKTIKYDTHGNILWEAAFNGTVNGGDYSNAMAIDQSGNIYVTGRVDYGNATGSDIVTIKYNSAGVQQWFSRYNGVANGLDEGRSICVNSDGSVFVGGKTMGVSSGLDFVAIKYNPDGTQAWANVYNGTGNSEDYAVSVGVDANDNNYIGGCSVGNGTTDIVVIKYNTSGTQQWLKRYNGLGNGGDIIVGLKIDSDNNIVVGGFTDVGSTEKFNFLTLKYNQNGNLLWEKQYNGSSSDIDLATAISVDLSNNIYLTGLTTQLFGTRLDSNYATIKYDKDGNQQWISFYDGPNNSIDLSRSIFVDNNQNVYVSGSSKGGTSDDYATIKYSPSGSQVWVMSYNGTGNLNDYSSSVIADNSGNVYVTGRSYGSGSDYDYATLKYSNIVGVEPVNNLVPEKFNLSQNYPNPFNPSTRIKFSIPVQQNVSIMISDVLGRIIKSDNLGTLSPATYEYNIDAVNFTSGIYFYSVITDQFRDTKKMILVK